MNETIKSRENPAVKRVQKLLKSAKFRRQQGAFAAEGFRLCRDAALSGVAIQELYLTKAAEERYGDELSLLKERAQSAAYLSGELMARLSDTVAPQGVLCVCRMLDKRECLYKMNTNGRFLCLEDLQDPANLGTILRTAEALGVDGVVMTENCCDPYNPKALRGGMGAVFRLKIMETGSMAGTVYDMNSLGILTLAAVPEPSARPVTSIRFTGAGAAVLIGNEGGGLLRETIAACSNKVTIPMRGRAESLNASQAAGILLWEMMRNTGGGNDEW